jgi:hypothetical protein
MRNDIIYTKTHIRLSLLDCVRLLLGYDLRVDVDVQVAHEDAKVLQTQSGVVLTRKRAGARPTLEAQVTAKNT